MSEHHRTEERDERGIAREVTPSADGRAQARALPAEPEGRPRLDLRTIERTVLIRFVDAEILFEEEAIQALGDPLDRLVEAGHRRLVLNLAGVHDMSTSMLGRLAGLYKRLEPKRGRIQLCGPDPLVRDVFRISHLDRVLGVYADEAEALGLIISGKCHMVSNP